MIKYLLPALLLTGCLPIPENQAECATRYENNYEIGSSITARMFETDGIVYDYRGETLKKSHDYCQAVAELDAKAEERRKEVERVHKLEVEAQMAREQYVERLKWEREEECFDAYRAITNNESAVPPNPSYCQFYIDEWRRKNIN